MRLSAGYRSDRLVFDRAMATKKKDPLRTPLGSRSPSENGQRPRRCLFRTGPVTPTRVAHRMPHQVAAARRSAASTAVAATTPNHLRGDIGALRLPWGRDDRRQGGSEKLE